MTASEMTLGAERIALEADRKRTAFPYLSVAAGVALLLAGSYIGLFVAPAEIHQGQVQRIMYVHVPTAWSGLLALTYAFICALAFLVSSKWKWDSRMEAAIEAGVLLCALLCTQGAIWAKPTWGVWWDWDPRLTTTAVLLFGFLGITALRKFVDEPVKRATWSAVATIVAYIDVPIVYFSVKWWNSLHQLQSSPATVAPAFRTPLLINVVGMMFLVFGLIALRARVADRKLRAELAPPLEQMRNA